MDETNHSSSASSSASSQSKMQEEQAGWIRVMEHAVIEIDRLMVDIVRKYPEVQAELLVLLMALDVKTVAEIRVTFLQLLMKRQEDEGSEPQPQPQSTVSGLIQEQFKDLIINLN